MVMQHVSLAHRVCIFSEVLSEELVFDTFFQWFSDTNLYLGDFIGTIVCFY